MAEKIVIASGKGGVGKSSLTAGLARALSGAGKRVLMLDMDIGLRSLDLIFGTQKDVLFDWGNVIDGGCEPNQAALAAGGLYITFAPSKNAEISMAFICEGVYGSSSLAQIAKPIYEYYFNSSQTAAAPQSENTLLG